MSCLVSYREERCEKSLWRSDPQANENESDDEAENFCNLFFFHMLFERKERQKK